MKYIDKITEQQNPLSINITNKSIFEVLSLINEEDAKIYLAIKKNLLKIEFLIKDVVRSMKNNGRLFYVGCGTSGRLGVLDASECPPTFSTDPDLVKGIISGGEKALYKSIEGSEDSIEDGLRIIEENNIQAHDIVIGISANGSAPYVLGALRKSADKNAITALLTFNKVEKSKYIKHLISIITGPEIISGSTRLKAGTATKMVLNMITTTAMIKLNKTYKNHMVDLKVSNNKLLNRAINIIHSITGLDNKSSKTVLKAANGEVKTALVMNKLQCSYSQAIKKLKNVSGNLSKILD